MAIHRLRKRSREAVIAEITQTLGDAAPVQEELRCLVEVLAQAEPTATRAERGPPRSTASRPRALTVSVVTARFSEAGPAVSISSPECHRAFVDPQRVQQ